MSNVEHKMPEARRRVKRGASYLDEYSPGWHDEIDLDTLLMRDPCQCVVGQLVLKESTGWSTFPWMCAMLNVERDQIIPLGFTAPNGGSRPDSLLPSYDALQVAWEEAITQRRGNHD